MVVDAPVVENADQALRAVDAESAGDLPASRWRVVGLVDHRTELTWLIISPWSLPHWSRWPRASENSDLG